MTISAAQYLIKNNGLQNEYVQTDDGLKELFLVQSTSGKILVFKSDPHLLLSELIEAEGSDEDGRLIVDRYRRVSRLVPSQWYLSDGQCLPTESVIVGGPSLKVRAELVDYLSRKFFAGNSDNAEMFMLWITSKVYQRTLDVVVGHVSLTLYGETGGVGEFLSKLLPSVTYLPLDLKTLNSKLISHYEVTSESEEMVLGSLFIPSDSYLIVDQTRMEDGKVYAVGVRNLQTLSTILQSYQIKYPIQSAETVTGEITCNLDWNVLVLSDHLSPCAPVEDLLADMSLGKKAPISSLLQTSLHLKCMSVNSEEPDYSKFREYFQQVLLIKDYSVPETTQEFIIQDFVEQRKNTSNYGEETLKTVLDVARLRSLSKGETQLSSDDYVWSRNQSLSSA